MENVTNGLVETETAVCLPKLPKRKGPKPGFKMPDNTAPPKDFVRIFREVAKNGGTRRDVAEALDAAGFHGDLNCVTQRERNMRKNGVNLPQLARGYKGGGGGKAKMDVGSLNAFLEELEGQDADEVAEDEVAE